LSHKLLLIACGWLAAVLALAQAPSLATYQGADRMQRIVDGAKKEGEVTIYTSAPVDDMKAMSDVFEKKYGVKVRLWRSSSENVLQRGITEARAGRFEADIFETNGPEMESLVKQIYSFFRTVPNPAGRPKRGW